MPNSFSQHNTFDCPQCRQPFAAAIWLIVDTSERPDLLEKIYQEKLHEVTCPQCGPIGQIDAPLLIFQPDAAPPLLFSPARQTTQEQDEQQAGGLLRQLHQSLGTRWQDGWLAEGLPGVERARLPTALKSHLEDDNPGQESDLHMAEQTPLIATIQEFIQANTWLDSRRIVEKHPELLSDKAQVLLEQLANVAAQQKDENTRQLFEEHCNLLQRCRELGIVQAFAEKMGVPPDAVEGIEALAQMPPELREVLQELAQSGAEIRTPEDLQRVLESRPDLRARLEKAMPQAKNGLAIPPEFAQDIQQAQQAEQRYRQTGERNWLDQAVNAWRRIFEHPSFGQAPERFRLAVFNNAGGVFLRRYWRNGDIQDLNLALNLWQQAVAATPPDSPDRPSRLNNLGNGLRDRYARTGRMEDLEEAIRVYQQAVAATPPDSPDRPSRLNNLGNGLRDRYARTGRMEDLEEAIHVYQQACELAEHCSSQVMLTSSRAWGNWAFERHAWLEASQAYTYGMRALQGLFQVQFSRAGKETWMRDAQGLSVRLAYALAKTGNSLATLEALENGRARLLGDALERSRHDLERLADPGTGQRELLERYRTASAQYTNLTRMTAKTDPLGEQGKARPGDWLRQIEGVRAEIETIVAEIRQVPGYETFLRPLTTGQIQQQAQITPLVYLTVTPASGLALVVTGQAVHSLDLPGLTSNSLRQQVIGDEGQSTYLRAYLAWRADPYHQQRLETWKQALDQTMNWIGEQVMQPVSAYLQTILPPGSPVILIPSDWLGLLPLHAAWQPDSTYPCGRRYALDEFTFSYAPSALALMRAQSQANAVSASGLLVVENPDQSLRLSKPAAAAALDLFDHKLHLAMNAATFEAVQEAINDYPVLYFFTHGVARFDDPLQSALTLADHPLRLADIFDLNIHRARLAVLAACETGVPSDLSLLDEAVSLPSGLMQAGVPGVVGSLWTVLESSTAILMTIFFEQWRKGGLTAPAALRQAQRILRDALYNPEVQDYFKASLPENTLSPAEVADILHKELHYEDFGHPFYWAAFTYTGL
jgi:CHAT domain-containing protein